MSLNEVELLHHNLTNHAPVSDLVIARFEEIRRLGISLGEGILVHSPPSRERSLALTNLEQAVMWAIASIARNQAL